MTRIDEAKLRAMSVHDRHRLWVNARGIDSAEARAVVELIENIGLPYSEEGSLKLDSPLGRKMEEIIFSAKGRAAGLEATKRGLPAMAGIDPLLAAALGVDYGPHNDATIQAGYLVAIMMRMQGCKNSGKKGKLPASCIAKTAEIFVPND